MEVIDSHTAGEPTRVVVAGAPDLGPGTLAERRDRLAARFDVDASRIVNEPRGSDVIVGAWLTPAVDASCTTGVIYFDNVGVIGMCGHGTIGVVATLAHLGRITPGAHRIETPVGIVATRLAADGTVTVENVPSHRAHAAVAIDVPGIGRVSGDVAWGGNWFYIVAGHGHELAAPNIEALTAQAWRIRGALNAQGHPEVDHIELVGPAAHPAASSRNFVLCPGKAYDRSPCGTGTSARLACLAADGALAEGERWVQESIIGSTFVASYRWHDRRTGSIVPSIAGRAFVTAETTLVFDELDPYRQGIRAR
ncbi:MAG: proline racemase family protein [Burkholderiales bacterium]|nr:proline racemase family protein [Burkholderiales bacterium]